MTQEGLVVARHRHRVAIEDHGGREHLAITAGRGMKPLVGDEVRWREEADGTAVIEAILERRSLLTRIDSRGRPEGVAANLTQLAVVVAPEPPPDWHLVDRYLAAAELLTIEGLIVWNKADIGAPASATRAYADLGYAVIATSTKTGAGLEELSRAMAGERSALVGQSGVGKSSLINALLGRPVQAIGALSDKGGVGRHTTSAAMLHRLAGDGELIDSPGVRQYAPHLDHSARLDRGFRDFLPLLGQCRFDNCVHDAEPGCAVKAAVQNGRIDRERYESYRKLKSTMDSLPS